MKCSVFRGFLFIVLCSIAFSTSTFAQGKFVYTNNDRKTDNSVSGFKVNGDGTLELLSGFPTGTDGGGGTPDTRTSNDKIVITERGPFLFASSDGDQEVASYKLDPNTGALTFIGTIDLGDGGPDEVLTLGVAPNENFLYVANNNDHKVYALKINNDGTLTQLEAEQLPGNFRALEMAISPNSKFLALKIFADEIDPDGRIVIFNIANDGTLSEAPGSPHFGSNKGRVGDMVFNCASNLLYIVKEFTGDPGVIDVYHVAQDGSISQIQGSPFSFPGLGASGMIAMSPNGKFLFTGYSSFNHPSIGVFKILPGGGLEIIPFAPFPTGYTEEDAGLSDIAVDATGQRLFATYENQHVESLIIQSDGRVVPIKGGVIATGEDSGENTSSLDSLAVYPLPKKCQITPPDDLTSANDLTFCGANVFYPPATTCGTDCGTVTCNPPSGSFFAVGTHTVTCSSEGADDASFKITVKDTQAPKIYEQPNIGFPTEPGKCSATAIFIISASDNCGAPMVVSDYQSGVVLPKGETTVHVTATDKAGNQSNYTFTVTIADLEDPKIACQADIQVNNEPNQGGKVVNFALPMVSDNCPGIGAPLCNPPSGTFFPVGVTNVNCSVKDSSNNQAQCSFKVTVKDTQPPQITCPGDMIAVAAKPCDTGLIVNYPGPLVNDNCPNNLMVICNPPSGTIFPVGAMMVTCTATDGGNNQTQCSFKVTVYDVRLQDDSNPGAVLLFNSFTGDYRLCCPGVNAPITGTGTVKKMACVTTLEHNTADRRLLAKVDPGINKGNATYQSPPGSLKCTITDKDLTNNTSMCP
jgi:6-phosphogluconolactonase (cycloisomerase 2 family)